MVSTPVDQAIAVENSLKQEILILKTQPPDCTGLYKVGRSFLDIRYEIRDTIIQILSRQKRTVEDACPYINWLKSAETRIKTCVF